MFSVSMTDRAKELLEDEGFDLTKDIVDAYNEKYGL